MGREIRRVPPDWQHPKALRMVYGANREEAHYIPMLDQTLEESQADWDASLAAWSASSEAQITWDEDKVYEDGSGAQKAGDLVFPTHEDYHGRRPTELYEAVAEEVGEYLVGCFQPYRHRGWTPEDATHFQVYETVSEGTPVSPVLASPEAVVEWAVSQGHSREAAERFVEMGSVPSMVSMSRSVRAGIDSAELLPSSYFPRKYSRLSER